MMKSEEADHYSDTASKTALLEKAKNEFNREKRLIIKNLPSNTTEKDIGAFMGFNGEFPVEYVDMVKNLNQAIVTLKDPSLGDDAISKLDCTKLDTLTVSVSVYRSEKILCIAQIARSMTEYRFRELVLEHGNIDMCFLMRSEYTGESKGYGFVEYNEPIEKVGQIKCALDWSSVDDQTVHCDAIVDSSQLGITFQELHSKCLIIDNLPKDYSDSIALREVFSVLVKPVYCQIVTKEGESLGFGIVEFEEADDAETAFLKFNQHKVNGVPMNIAYCIPGKSAVHMFNRIMFKYGDRVRVSRSSLLPDPVYPNPAFLKHMFFKMHLAKHPRLLVQFTDNLLHLQDGYVKKLEGRTNAKPGILGPAPTIPMSPLMDINLQLGLLSVIVLDMREKGTYNGEVPEPLGKVKIPTDEEFQEKAQPVSLLGDPMTAQANVILRNLLMPEEKPLFQKSSSTDEGTPQLLGKSMHELNMVYLCSFGRLMAMLSEKTQSMGILGNAPNIPANRPASGPPKPLMEGVSPKPLMEGLMQAGQVAQTLLNSIGIGQQNLTNQFNRIQKDCTQQKGLLGNPPMMNMNTAKAASKFMNTIQQMAFKKMSQTQNAGSNQDLNSLFGNNNGSSGNMNKSGGGLLGSYQSQGRMQNQHQSKNQLSGASEAGKAPQSLLALNFNNKGDGLIPTPLMDDDSSFHGIQGYDDSGYQGGYEDGGCNEGFVDAQGNFDDRSNNSANHQSGNKTTARSLMDPDFDVTGSSNRFDGVYFSGINARQKTGTGMNRVSENRDGHYSDIAQQAAFYAAGAAAAYKHQYEEWAQSGYNQGQGYDGSNDSGYPANYSPGQSNYGQDGTSLQNQQWGSYMGSDSGNGGPPSLLGCYDNSGGQPNSVGSYSGNGGQSSSMGSYSGNGGPPSLLGSYSCGNGGQPNSVGSYSGSGGQSRSMGSYSGNNGPPSLLGSYSCGNGGQPNSMGSYSGSGGPPSLLGSYDESGGQPSSKASHSGNGGPPSLLGSYDKSGGQPSSTGSYSGSGGPPSLLGSYDESGGQPSSTGSYSGNGGPPSLLGSYDKSGGQPSSMGSYSGNGGPPSLLGSYSGNDGPPSLLGSYASNGNMKSGSSSLIGRERNSRSGSSGYAGSHGRDGPRSLMGPPSIRPLQGTASWGSGVSQSSLARTPLCQKRSFSHVLPSPEPSPEGEYIGQHSQGLGGHYADTYTKRQKLSGRF